MRIYKQDVLEEYRWVMPKNPEDQDRFDFDGVSRKESWKPVEMEELVENEADGSTDRVTAFPWCRQDSLMLRDEAIDRLGPLLREHGEVLPLHCEGMRLAVFNCLVLADALDEEKSGLVHFPSSNELQDVESYVFQPEKVRDLRVFKLGLDPRGPLLFTEDAVDAFAEAGLGAIRFTALWDSEEGSYGDRSATEFRGVDRKIE